MKKSVAVLGANGLLGSDLVKYLAQDFDTYPLTRDNYGQFVGKSFDYFINANGNSKRFWALQNVYDDFEASTISVYKSIFDFKINTYIYISSSDVYANHSDLKNTIESSDIDVEKLNSYGLHKYLSEQIVRNNQESYLILRLSMILGQALKKGPFYDIINGTPLFITEDSQLQLITSIAIANIIRVLIHGKTNNEILNVGGRGAFGFSDIGKYFTNQIQWSKSRKKQHYEMNVAKLDSIYKLKTSSEYLGDWLNEKKKSK